MVVLCCDHGGFKLKEKLKEYLAKNEIETFDVGTNDEQRCDYTMFAKKGAQKVLEDEKNLGVFICKSGIGMSIAANRFKGIRAALCSSVKFAELSKQHNNANVLVLGASYVSTNKAIKILKTFLNSNFLGGRHLDRVLELDKLGND